MSELIIKQGWNGRLVELFTAIGQQRSVELVEKITSVVAESFEANKAPMRNKTTREINRRLDLAVDIVISCRDKRWAITRIIDELGSLMDEKLDIADKRNRRDGVWGQALENPEPLVPDEEDNEQ